MDYRYICLTEDNTLVKGNLAAANQDIAAKLLNEKGYTIFSLKQVSAFMPSGIQISKPFSRIRPEIIINFSRQLALLLESGNDIITSLEILQAQSSNKYFKKVIGDIITDLRGGSRMADAMAKHSKVFNRIYIQAIGIGERSGNLEMMLRQVAEYIEKDLKVAKGLKNALRYPAIVGVIALLVIGVLIIYVLPSFTDLYSSLGADLPVITSMMLSLFKWLSIYGGYLLLGVLLLGVLVYLYTRTPNGNLLKDKLILKIPALGKTVHLNELVRCSRSMSILYQAGLPMPEIMSLVIENSNNLVIREALAQVQRDVLRGEGLSQSMTKSDYFLPMMVQMVGVGETTGNIDVTLSTVAENYENEAADIMQALVGYLQPAIVVVIGAVMAVIAFSLVSTMYSMYGQAL